MPSSSARSVAVHSAKIRGKCCRWNLRHQRRKAKHLLRPGAGLGVTREEADFDGMWLPGGVGAAGAFPRRWEALRHFGVRALVFGPTPISQSSLVAGVTESIAGSPSSPTEGLKIGRSSR